MTSSLILAFQPAQGRAVGGGKSGKDDGEALPGFDDMLGNKPAAKEKPGRHMIDAISGLAGLAEKLHRTMPLGEKAQISPDREAAPDESPEKAQDPDAVRMNQLDAFPNGSVPPPQPPVTLPVIQFRGEPDAEPQEASPRKALDSFLSSGETDVDEPANGRSPGASGAIKADANRQPDLPFSRKLPPDSSADQISPENVERNAPARVAKDSGPPVLEASSAKPLPQLNVLSQQHFPAPAQTTVASLTQSLASDETFALAMSRTHPVGVPNSAVLAPAHTLRIELHPAELGTVTANLRMVGEQLSIELKVETVEAHRRLSSDSEAIVSGLRGLGYDIDKVTIVQPAAAAARQDAASGSGGGPRGGEQSWSRNGNERSQGQRRGDGDARNGEGRTNATTSVERAGSGVFI